ncbi:hypothetical protein E2C01_097949 [Portunus trituberculatus]|uniref:Uncharacterized protein n=1 Tax=Portunus trituberculatus TaxID=210409 RepID=A0A5B7JZY7_PORTR|nr:hypothetical protein [Portunus trituberculatus]
MSTVRVTRSKGHVNDAKGEVLCDGMTVQVSGSKQHNLLKSRKVVHARQHCRPPTHTREA